MRARRCLGLAGDWLDAGDALLWLVAFFAIEMNVLGAERGRNGYPCAPREGRTRRWRAISPSPTHC
ncbi:MAG: hypothetical protein M5R42_04680 [Rhodocyclaceae bacterium]|nr:hypothetical protein [Rhodocyclaceae bacterium]